MLTDGVEIRVNTGQIDSEQIQFIPKLLLGALWYSELRPARRVRAREFVDWCVLLVMDCENTVLRLNSIKPLRADAGRGSFRSVRRVQYSRGGIRF